MKLDLKVVLTVALLIKVDYPYQDGDSSSFLLISEY